MQAILDTVAKKEKQEEDKKHEQALKQKNELIKRAKMAMILDN